MILVFHDATIKLISYKKEECLGCVYDPFIRYTDGCHKISIEEYVLYYRYIGERLNEPKLINNILKQKDAGLYLIKHDGYYGFL